MKLPIGNKIGILHKVNWSCVMFKVSAAAFLISLFSQMYLTNKLAIRSSELSELSSRKEQLEKEIAALNYENSLVSSLSYIESKALSDGFVEQIDSVLVIRDASTAVLLPQGR